MSKPALLLDVDGVLCPFGCDEDAGFSVLRLGEDGWVWTDPAHVERLATLAREFELVWATAWEHNANSIISPHYKLPTLDVIEFNSPPPDVSDIVTGFESWKLPWIIAWTKQWDRPWAWIDDDIRDDARYYAMVEYDHPALTVRTDPVRGLTNEHVEQLLQFAAEVRERDSGAA